MTERFDPEHALGDGIFGLPYTAEEAEVVLIPVPWEPTVSYGAGTANGPEAILRASPQLDLLDRETGTPYERGIHMLPIPAHIRELSDAARADAKMVIEAGGAGDDPGLLDAATRVNVASEQMNAWVYDTAKAWLAKGRLVGVVGGDHSSPFGLIRAVSERHPDVGVLHIDAHADLREAYEGFTWSHASIMFNVFRRLPGVSHIVQVGIRDYSASEAEVIERNKVRFTTHFDADLKAKQQDGTTWGTLAKQMVAGLPKDVYVSFDIDGLDPVLCPHTGTPVPGGLQFAEATRLLREVAAAGKRIVGFDLVEVAPAKDPANEWDGNVGARMLYKLCGFGLKTRK